MMHNRSNTTTSASLSAALNHMILLAACCAPVSLKADSSQEREAVSISKKFQLLSKENNKSQSRAALEELQTALAEKKQQLQDLLEKASILISSGTMEENRAEVEREIEAIQQERRAIRELELSWKKSVSEIEAREDGDAEFDGIWHQPDTTVGQLVIDYNSSDVVYVMPPEIAGMKVHLSSQLAVPKAVWSDMLDLILSQMGVGVKQVMPFVKQLYFLRVNQSGLKLITDDRNALLLLPEDAKVAFAVAAPPGDLRRIHQFIDRFSPQEQLSVQVAGGQLLFVGMVREIRELLKVYDFITAPKRAQEYRIVSLEKADSEEVSKILTAIFDGDAAKGGSEPKAFGGEKGAHFMPLNFGSGNEASSGFRVVAMKYPASSLFLMGKVEQIEKAVHIIRDIEMNIGEIQDKTIYWYACQHSESEELAKVLSQVYVKLLASRGMLASKSSTTSVNVRATVDEKLSPAERVQKEARAEEWNLAHPQDSLIVPPTMISLSDGKKPSGGNINDNFIVDPKTNSIIMVVENFVLPKLKELLQKLDVPKRMVQIDVLMFEKKVSNSSSFGLNLLKTGKQASGKHNDSISWNNHIPASHKSDKHHHKKDRKSENGIDLRGVLQFAMSRGKGGALPAYDLAYQFLLSQDDIQINANPSVITVNQTPAKISVVDQISINMGAVEYDKDHFKDSYSRAEYGITIQITPTVHAKGDSDGDTHGAKFVTMTTEIVFDTTHPSKHDRPEVTRRNIKNEVRVRDGETIILGGLRKKHSTGSRQSIPFLGDIPGIGKLFSNTTLSDQSSEMFIFITPKIVPDNREVSEKIRFETLKHRPGDIPEFLAEIENARMVEKKALFQRSFELIFSPPITNSHY